MDALLVCTSVEFLKVTSGQSEVRF